MLFSPRTTHKVRTIQRTAAGEISLGEPGAARVKQYVAAATNAKTDANRGTFAENATLTRSNSLVISAGGRVDAKRAGVQLLPSCVLSQCTSVASESASDAARTATGPVSFWT